MVSEIIDKIEKRINDAPSLSTEKKNDLLDLLGNLKNEVKEIPVEKKESAESMAKFMDASTHEALRTEKKQHLVDLAIEGLSSSAHDFEASHPSLTNYINRICDMLANIGI